MYSKRFRRSSVRAPLRSIFRQAGQAGPLVVEDSESKKKDKKTSKKEKKPKVKVALPSASALLARVPVSGPMARGEAPIKRLCCML